MTSSRDGATRAVWIVTPERVMTLETQIPHRDKAGEEGDQRRGAIASYAQQDFMKQHVHSLRSQPRFLLFHDALDYSRDVADTDCGRGDDEGEEHENWIRRQSSCCLPTIAINTTRATTEDITSNLEYWG